MRTRIYSNPLFYRHDTGPGHPERADRLDAALEGVRRSGLAGEIVESTAPPSTDRLIGKVHSREYARSLELACVTGSKLFHSLDNSISPATYEAARLAVGAGLEAANDLFERGAVERAFVIARPPGHHAEKVEAMGFCYFNTVACIAEALLERDDVSRVAIFDWDVHHGNGTQHIFYDREDVLFLSMHRFPFYPGTGAASEIGEGRGRGTTKNIPFAAGTGEAEYLRAMEEQIVPAIEDYAPDAILISAGFDAHRRDPLGGMRLSEAAFGEMTNRMVELADRFSKGRLLSLLEGGYDAEGLASSVAEHLAAMSSSRRSA